MHNFSALHRSAGDGAVVVSGHIPGSSAAETIARPIAGAVGRARLARPADAAGIAALIARFAHDGTLLARSASEVSANIDAFMVITAVNGDVLACAALQEYSPSLAEVASVAVAPEAQGRGLGSRVVRAVERLARRRGHRELFALSLADHFFETLGYHAAPLTRYPEKLARYAALTAAGASLVPKRCFRKRLRSARQFSRLANSPMLVSAPTVYHARPAR
jgi:amino-acid N-acetyltransferase